jgi:glutaredoxin
MADVKIYGADWCHDTKDTLAFLQRLDVNYDYIDIDDDPTAAAWVRQQNNGKEKKPTLDVKGQVLTNPTHGELEDALRAEGIL